MKEMAAALVQSNPDTVVIITPHGPVYSDVLSVRAQRHLEGDFRAFGAGECKITTTTDLDVVRLLTQEIDANSKTPLVVLDDKFVNEYRIEKKLDHGVMVPLHFLVLAGYSGQIVVIHIGFFTYLELYEFGISLYRAIKASGKRVGVIASGDLAHRLTSSAPAGYNPRAKDLDAEIVRIVKEFDAPGLIHINRRLVEDGGECGIRPLAILMGSLDKYQVSPRVLAYAGPYGVGYCVALFNPGKESSDMSRLRKIKAARSDKMVNIISKQSFPVALARKTGEEYVRSGSTVKIKIQDVPPEFRGKAGVFVSIHKDGMLRGCIGTIQGMKASIAEEIVSNAINAATKDPRFEPIRQDELDYLDFSVDILSGLEPVEDMTVLDAAKYGILVEKGSKSGLLLPDLPGVDTVERQLAIAKQKAGIAANDTDVKIYRFSIRRYS